MSRTSQACAGGRRHRRCPVCRVSCTCTIPRLTFYACCGYWCDDCGGNANARRVPPSTKEGR